MQGLTFSRIPEGRPGAGICVCRLHYSADVNMRDQVAIALARSKYTKDWRWRREMEIEENAGNGKLLYPEFNYDRNTCAPFDCSNAAEWTIWHGADPHPSTPHAHVWEAFSSHGDQVICGELWPNDGEHYRVAQYVEVVKWLESDATDKPMGWEWANGKKLTVFQRVMDVAGKAFKSEDGEDYFDKYRMAGLDFLPAPKSEAINAASVDTIGKMLSGTTPDFSVDWPQLRVFNGCVETISEFQSVRFKEGDPERNSDEKVFTYRRHALDCITYLQSSGACHCLPKSMRRRNTPDSRTTPH